MHYLQDPLLLRQNSFANTIYTNCNQIIVDQFYQTIKGMKLATTKLFLSLLNKLDKPNKQQKRFSTSSHRRRFSHFACSFQQRGIRILNCLHTKVNPVSFLTEIGFNKIIHFDCLPKIV